jgi:hypothetical protein
MKKQVTILTFLFFHCFFLWSQQFVKTTTPCNDELLKNTPGQWIHWGDPLQAKISKQQQQEIFNRLETIHQFVYTIFPSPLGIDVEWRRSTGELEFAQQVITGHLPDGRISENFINGIPLVIYSYFAKFDPYSCGRNTYEMMKGYPREDGAIVEVVANDLNGVLQGNQGGIEGMQINGRYIRTMKAIKGKWKSYTQYQLDPGSDMTMVLLHREGMLPYVPVTRKQYLDLSIIYFNKFYDKMIADFERTDSLYAKLYTDMGKKPDWESRKEQKEKFRRQKNDVIKYYQDELAATIAAGLPDSPAIISGGMCNVGTTYPIFISEAEGGKMLVTENPAYFRKDLPKYIPQLFVLLFDKYPWSFIPKKEPITLMEENFPIEKLQAMIDK